MKPTKPFTLVVVAALAALAGFIANAVLVGNGRAAVALPITLGIALAVMAVLALVIAWPVRGAAAGKRRIEFQRAVAALSFAKASEYLGATFAGAGAGVLVFALSRPVVAMDALLGTLVSLGGALALTVCGVIAESWCKLPPEDDEAERAGVSPDPA